MVSVLFAIVAGVVCLIVGCIVGAIFGMVRQADIELLYRKWAVTAAQYDVLQKIEDKINQSQYEAEQARNWDMLSGLEQAKEDVYAVEWEIFDEKDGY